jgi:hypothetical protein
MDLLLARYPHRLNAEHSIIEEEMIALNLEGKSAAVTAMIGMLSDLHRDGRRCRFIKSLKGLPLQELKTRSRGGQKGGARVYFWLMGDAAGIVNCEAKAPDEPASQQQLATALKVYIAHQAGIRVFERAQEDDNSR